MARNSTLESLDLTAHSIIYCPRDAGDRRSGGPPSRLAISLGEKRRRARRSGSPRVSRWVSSTSRPTCAPAVTAHPAHRPTMPSHETVMPARYSALKHTASSFGSNIAQRVRDVSAWILESHAVAQCSSNWTAQWTSAAKSGLTKQGSGVAEVEVQWDALLLGCQVSLPLQVGLARMVAGEAKGLGDHSALTVPAQDRLTLQSAAYWRALIRKLTEQCSQCMQAASRDVALISCLNQAAWNL